MVPDMQVACDCCRCGPLRQLLSHGGGQANVQPQEEGRENSKCGNKYLAWAFVEAANFARRYDESCRKWFERKAAKTSNIIAIKALACKLAKAAWYLMAEGTDYDPKRMFGQPAKTK